MAIQQILTDPFYLLYLIVNSREFNYENNNISCNYNQYIEKEQIEQRIIQLENELFQIPDEDSIIKNDIRESINIFNVILQKLNEKI